MKFLKRMTCLLLAILMLPTAALAAENPGMIIPGTGGSSHGSAGTVSAGSLWSSKTDPNMRWGPGLLLHVEQVPTAVTFDYTGTEPKPVGYGNVLGYWTTHFPNTDPDQTQTGIYLLPTWSKSQGDQVAIQLKKSGTCEYSYQQMTNSQWMFNGETDIRNWVGNTAYLTAAVGLSNANNPNYSLKSNYWQSAISSLKVSECLAILAQLFTGTDSSKGIVSGTDVTEINERVLYYLGVTGTENDWGDLSGAQKDVGLFMNYCGFLATVIACLPSAERDKLAKQLDTMCQDYLSGSPSGYKPMVVTGELVIATEYNGDDQYSCWWTPQQCLSAVTGVSFSADDLTTKLNGSGNAINQLGAGRTGKTNKGGMTMYGRLKNGVWSPYESSDGSTKMPVYGRVISSVDQEILSAYGVSKPGIEGFGVWGLPRTPTPPPTATPPVPDFTAMGSVSLLVEEKQYVKSVGGYSETFKLTITANLGASYSVDSDDAALSERGAGFANTLLWLHQQRQAGHSFANPVIKISIAQAEAVAALSGTNSEYLINETYGYSGDGDTYTKNSAGKSVASNQVEASIGSPFTWTRPPVNLGGNFVFKDNSPAGIKTYTADGYIQIEFTDLLAAYEYFQVHSDTLTFIGEVPGSGTLEAESSKNQHWFKVGCAVHMSGPTSVSDLDSVKTLRAGLECTPKYDYSTVSATPADDPYYYSRYQPAYSEFKQGTVPTSGGGSDEKFNSMTGTPTFTETTDREDFDGTIYDGQGQFYQYFASGGSEFVVQFDGKYVETANASRTYTATFSPVGCNMNNGSHHYETVGDPPHQVHIEDAAHCPCNYHDVSDTFTWTQQVKGFSYVQITNLKVWKLSEAKLDGTRELLDTDEVTATVQSVAPSLSYNIAGANTAAEGRLVYSYNTNQKDSAIITGYPKASDNDHSAHRTNNQKTLDGDTAGVTCNAICISDYIVLRTSNGDQSILYYEYKSKNEAAINKGNCVAEAIEFDKVPYATIWKGNSQTSAGCGLPEDGITYGGYNGNYSSTSAKYKSSGHPSNLDFNSTTVYKNKSVMSGSWDAVTEKPTQKFRLLNDRLIIPDNKQNGEYVLGESYIFYENIVNSNTGVQPNYPIVKQSNFGSRSGFVIHTTYSPSHDKINDVVVYNAVSNENAMIVSLPKERDQRIKESLTESVVKTEVCPGDATCPFLELDCSETQHIHTEECYQQVSYEVHGPNNVHEHTAACWSGVSGWYVTHGSGCSYAGQRHFTTSQSTCTTCGHSCGGTYEVAQTLTCNNLPLNKHVCNASGSGSMSTGQSTTYNYTGGVQQVTLGPGTYKLETWGAQGGSTEGGLGGYSVGQISLTTTTTLYVVVGGQGGNPNSTSNGGYNGGGYSIAYGTGGGGATHIATAAGLLQNLSSNKTSILLVAGGGGGYAGRAGRPGGDGGGTAGGAGFNGCGGSGYGGTQTAAGASGRNGSVAGFGFGGNQTAFGNNGGAGGGGGWYGGGAGGNDYSSYSDNDDSGGGGGSGYIGGVTSGSTSAGVQSGNGKAVITAVSVTPTTQCYTMYKSILACDNPHHAYSYNWKLYTYGLMHKSGKVCTGRNCTDTSDLIFPTQEVYTQAQCAAGYIVRHANGDVHLTTSLGTCSYCGATYKEVLSAAQTTDREPDPSEYSHYVYGDSRCWDPCGDPANHQKYVTEITDSGKTYTMGDFINLDYGFEVYFPNTGDFYGTGAKASSQTSPERGYGYTNGMDTTIWIQSKWIEFPFAVVYDGQTFLAYERIYLDVPTKLFDFYIPLHDYEVAQAEIKYGTIAINAQNGDMLECGTNASRNIQAISYNGKRYAHHHNADKRTVIDVVGRIGALTLEDTGDFRFSNFFKQTVSGWLVKNIVKKVDFTKPNNLFTDQVDVRGVPIANTGVAANTYGTKTERSTLSKLFQFPITPAKNNVTALQRQPIRVGYDSYFDLTTLGNYYGNAEIDDSGEIANQNLLLIKPRYYRLDLDTGIYNPVDVYMDVNGNKVLINDHDSNTVSYSGSDSQVNLNWVEESARRNFSGNEVTFTKNVDTSYPWITIPKGSSWVYGNYNLLNLTQRNRTFIGFEETYGDDKDPSERLADVSSSLQGARWHFNIGLPSSAVFVYSGQAASKENIDACAAGSAVIFCALEIYAQGEVWTLAYDGSNINKPFTVTPGGNTFDPVIPYPAGKSPKGEEMPIVAVFSINHSSKEDLNTAGTH